MRKSLGSLILSCCLAVSAQVQTPEMNAVFTKAAASLAAMPFDAKAPVSIRGRIATLVWPEGTAGMVVVEGPGGERYAFLTAGVPKMAKQGFSRFTAQPGTEVIVTGVLAAGGAKIGPGAIAARADAITKIDGTRMFDRAKIQ